MDCTLKKSVLRAEMGRVEKVCSKPTSRRNLEDACGLLPGAPFPNIIYTVQ